MTGAIRPFVTGLSSFASPQSRPVDQGRESPDALGVPWSFSRTGSESGRTYHCHELTTMTLPKTWFRDSVAVHDRGLSHGLGTYGGGMPDGSGTA